MTQLKIQYIFSSTTHLLKEKRKSNCTQPNREMRTEQQHSQDGLLKGIPQ
jgi:hypothetical protein